MDGNYKTSKNSRNSIAFWEPLFLNFEAGARALPDTIVPVNRKGSQFFAKLTNTNSPVHRINQHLAAR